MNIYVYIYIYRIEQCCSVFLTFTCVERICTTLSRSGNAGFTELQFSMCFKPLMRAQT